VRIEDWLSWVWHSIRMSPGRSFLTATGIAIGIMAVALLTSIGSGLRLYLLDSFSQFGTHIISITPGKSTVGGVPGLLKTIRPLTVADANQLRSIHDVDFVVPAIQGNGNVEAKLYSSNTQILGANNDAKDAFKFLVDMGRFLPPGEDSKARNFVVLGPKLKREIFPNTNPLGQLVRIGGVRYRVIGVLKSKGNILGFDFDDIAIIPIARALELFNREGVQEINLIYNPSASPEQVAEKVRQRLLKLHGREDFTIITQKDMLATLDKILRVITLGISALGGISLFVGGVGVLTIMTTTMRERTAEIGLLCALGTTRRRILLLFLGESVALSMLGGLLGIGLMFILYALAKLFAPELPLSLQPFYLMLAIALSSLIGLIAGLAPARNAAKLNPVDALRAE